MAKPTQPAKPNGPIRPSRFKAQAIIDDLKLELQLAEQESQRLRFRLEQTTNWLEQVIFRATQTEPGFFTDKIKPRDPVLQAAWNFLIAPRQRPAGLQSPRATDLDTAPAAVPEKGQ